MKFTIVEEKFLNSLEEARIATSHNDTPHVKPVSFIYMEKTIVIATDYDTRTFKNLKKNSNVSVVIDIYKPGAHKAVCIQGTAKILEKGKEFKKIYQIFEKKFEWVRNEPWEECEAPFLKIIPKRKSSWGIK